MIPKCEILTDKNVAMSSDAQATLREISQIPSVEHMAAVPDFHFKDRMEAPSSLATATTATMIPHLTSASLNCGMGLLRTGISRSEFTNERIRDFLIQFRATVTETEKYDLNVEELLNILQHGAKAILEKYSLPLGWLQSIEQCGVFDSTNHKTENDFYDILAKENLLNQNHGMFKDLGIGFSGNHFVEIQEVSQIFNPDACQHYNLSLGEMVIMYHGGGGVVPWYIGRYFANRLKASNSVKFFYNKSKFHFGRLADIHRAPQRWHYYFGRRKFVAIQDDTEEGRRMAFAQAASMNYGYAYRMVAVARFVHSLRFVFSDELPDAELLHDSSHNHIASETIDGKSMWVHRHNSCRVVPGAIHILPGYHTTSSFVGLGADGAEAFLNTMPHGAGHTIKKYFTTSLSKQITHKKTLKYLNGSTEPVEVCHVTDEGINSVVNSLQSHNIFKPIAKLTPIAVLKGYRG